MKLKSGHEVVPTTKEETEKLIKLFPQYKNGAIRLMPGGWFYLPTFTKYADKIYEFKFRPTDVVVSTWPKCGTTWTQEIVWTMLHDRNYDNEKSKLTMDFRSPFLEFDSIRENSDGFRSGENYQGVDVLEELCGKRHTEGVMIHLAEHISDPRILKTHLPFSLLHPKMLDTCKVIYVARNPKDVFLSYLHHHYLIKRMPFVGDTSEFLDYYLNDSLVHSPFWENVKEAWERRNHKNLLWIYYESMKKDPMKDVKRINEFLETNIKEEELHKIIEHTQFDKMQKRDPTFGLLSKDEAGTSVNVDYQSQQGGFFRKGTIGDWKDKLTKNQNEKLDKWIAEKSKGIDINFDYG